MAGPEQAMGGADDSGAPRLVVESSGEAALDGPARLLAETLGFPFGEAPRADDDREELRLVLTPAHLEIRWRGDDAAGSRRLRPIFVDLARIDVRSPAGATKRQPLAKAVGLKRGSEPPTVVDATAGFGEDTWLLAALGCGVLAVERNAVVLELLRDGLRRMAESEPEVSARVELRAGEAMTILPTLDPPPDVVYLDPMFPPRRGSALEGKTMRLLRRLVGPDGDSAELLPVARALARRRVVVKRPRHAPPLGEKPDRVHEGKSLRYDVYFS